jgi:hypothetical protein
MFEIVKIHPLGREPRERIAMSTTDDKALDYVGKIMDAYKAAEKAGRDALTYALDCGKHLNAAKNTVDAANPSAKGKWKAWCDKNLTVSMETEGIYRRLADAVAQDEKFFVGCKSIRDAIKRRAKYEEDEDGNLKAKPTPQRGNGNRRQTRSGATTHQPTNADTGAGLETELENAAPDEIISSIANDVDKLEEVAVASIAKLTPEKVCKALTDAWTADQLRELQIKLTAHLGSMATQSSPTWRSGSSIERRAV